MNGIYGALSGAIAQQVALDAVAENVANANTTGYRAEKLCFEEVLRNGNRMVVATRGAQDQTAGPLQHTGQPLDVALEGEGALQVMDGRGDVHALRGGALTRDADGVLVDAQGRSVLAAGGGTLVIPPDARDIAIGEDGALRVDGEITGRLALVGSPRVRSGALEGSNVNVVHSLVELIQVSRTYEALTRMIEGFKSVDERTARELGSPR